MSAQYKITGGHVLAALLGFFALIIAANAAFLYFAVKTFPGEKEKKSYRQGVQFNEVLEARAAQDALGWRASIDTIVREGEAVTLVVSFATGNAAPLDGLSVTGALVRPASTEGARDVAFAPAGAGRYEAVVAADAGAWDLSVTASSSSGARFEFTNRISVP